MQKNSRWIRWLLSFLIFLLTLVGICYFLLQTSLVQNYISQKIIASLSEKLNTKIEIGKIRINFFDHLKIEDLLIYDQLDDTLGIGTDIDIDIGIFSLLGKEIVVDEIKMDKLYINLYAISDSSYNFTFLTLSPDSPTTASAPEEGWQFVLDEFGFNRVLVAFEDSDQILKINQNKIKGSFREFDIDKNRYLLSKLTLDEGDIMFSFENIKSQNVESTFSLPGIPIELGVEELILNQQDISVLIDEKNYDFNNLELVFKNFIWSNTSLKMHLDQGGFTFDNELAIKNLKAEISADTSNIFLSNIGVKTEDDFIDFSRLSLQNAFNNVGIEGLELEISASTLNKFKSYLPAGFNFVSGASFQTSINGLEYNESSITGRQTKMTYGQNKFTGDFSLPIPYLEDSKVYANIITLNLNLEQVSQIYPKLNLPTELKDVTRFNLSGIVKGKMSNLELRSGRLVIADKLEAKFSGNLYNVLNPEIFSYALSSLEAKVDSSFIAAYKKPGLGLDKVGGLNFNGKVGGDLDRIKIDGISSSDLGILGIEASFIFPNEQSELNYNGKLSFETFDLGLLLENPDIGQISLVTNLEGAGLNPEIIDGRINADVGSFTYRGYSYQNIDLEVIVSDCIVNGDFVIDDPNAKFSFNGKINLESKPFIFDFESLIDTINFTSLNLDLPKFGISGGLTANFTLPIQQENSGKIAFRNFKANDFVHAFKEDSMVITLSKLRDSSYIDISSSMLDAHVDGIFKIMELPSAFSDLYNHYALGDSITLDTLFDKSDSKSIHITANIQSLKFLQFYDVESEMNIKQANVDFNFDFEKKEIIGDFMIDSALYDKIFVENARIKTTNFGSSVKIDLDAHNLKYNNINLPIVSLKNILSQKYLETDVLIQDEDRLPKLKVGTRLYGINDEIQWKFNDSLVLNNEEWFIRKDNEILVNDSKILIKNLVIYDKDEQMSIKSLDSAGNNVSILFEEFNIGQFVSLLSMEKSNVSGRMNGDIELRDLYSNPFFLANLTLNNMVYAQKPVGSIELKADENPKTGLISGTFDLIGSRNDILGRGSFDPETRKLDWNIYAGLLEMRLLDPFLDEFISNSEGVIFGEAYIGGTIDRPEVNGEFTLEDIATTIDINNTRYNFENHLLTFDNQKIDIGSIELFDQLGNSAIVSGRINHNYYSDLILDLQLTTDKFLFLNTSKINNPIFYGKVILSANVDITGPPDLLDVQVFAKSLDETSITLSPFSETESILKEEFIRYGKPGDFDDLTSKYLQKLGREYPFNVYLNLEANDDSEFTFVVDPLSGDKLNCNGNGNLQINLDPYGDQEIYGRYTVTDGSYLFSYGDFINKKFKLTPGGTINFNGNPFNAKLDVKAVYSAYTTTYELIRNEVSLSDSEAQAAQRRTKVNVVLSMSGSLMEPEITLDVEIPDLQSGTLIASIDRKLNELRNNPDELNNQVFGLLVFNSFILSESTTTDLNTVSQGIALSSISNLISNQLNGLAQNVLRGVDVSIDVNSYNSQYLNEGAGGNITEVGLNVSKQLFNDRVKISAGGNLNFDNSVNNQNQFSNFIGDFVVEYKLNEQGNYRLRVFSRSNYDQLLNQNSSKTGVSLFFNKEFDSKIKED